MYPRSLRDVFVLTAQYPPVDSPLSEFSFRIADALSTVATVYVVAPGLQWQDIGNVRLRGFVNPVYDHQNVITWAFSACREAERIVATSAYERGARGPVIAVNWELFPAALSVGRFFSFPVYFIPHSFELQRGNSSSLLSMAIKELEKLAVSAAQDTLLFGREIAEYYYKTGGNSDTAVELPVEQVQPFRKKELAESLMKVLGQYLSEGALHR
ncbi:MAG: hypothetical protein ACP5T5_02210 [Thermoprotei archaeon]|nr:hypothetical protein [TACK group archaeon]